MSNPVKAWREQVGLTQEQAAHKLGVTVRNYQAYEHGDYQPTAPVRKLMRAVAIGLDLDPWPTEAKQPRDIRSQHRMLDVA